jgi:hypothetical protein
MSSTSSFNIPRLLSVVDFQCLWGFRTVLPSNRFLGAKRARAYPHTHTHTHTRTQTQPTTPYADVLHNLARAKTPGGTVHIGRSVAFS